MTVFFAVGIVLNVVLTGLALYWLWRQRMPRTGKDETRKIQNDRGHDKRGQSFAPDEANGFLTEHSLLLINSYRHWTGCDLVDPGISPVEQAKALYEAPFVMASHGIGEDPVFNLVRVEFPVARRDRYDTSDVIPRRLRRGSLFTPTARRSRCSKPAGRISYPCPRACRRSRWSASSERGCWSR